MISFAKKLRFLFPFLILFAIPECAQSGGPLYITGLSSTNSGQPYRWGVTPVTYRTDRGGLGKQTNAQANTLVSSAFQAWEEVDTASIRFQNLGLLEQDITEANIFSFLDRIGDCDDTSAAAISIIYDAAGSIIEALGFDSNSVLGIAGFVCTDDIAGLYQRGLSVLNGRFIDGQPDSPSHKSISVAAFKMAQIHEIGHMLGLDHSQVNLSCLTGSGCTADELAGVPVMFPVMLTESKTGLSLDDRSSISTLYPADDFHSTTGRIQGTVLFSDGRTPAQGYNVIARSLGSEGHAVSSVSGYLYTAGAGNPLMDPHTDLNYFFGSRDQTLIGFYDIAGLPPGTYSIKVEAINHSGIMPFVGSSSVGPVGAERGFQFAMPGRCAEQYLQQPSSPELPCDAVTTVLIEEGTFIRNADIIMLGTPPQFDTLESEEE